MYSIMDSSISSEESISAISTEKYLKFVKEMNEELERVKNNKRTLTVYNSDDDSEFGKNYNSHSDEKISLASYVAEKRELMEEIAVLKSQLSNVIKLKNEIQYKLERSEATIQLLKTENCHLMAAAFPCCINSFHRRIKSCSERDIINYIKKIDQLPSSMKSSKMKVKEWAFLALESELQRVYQQLLNEEAECMCHLTKEKESFFSRWTNSLLEWLSSVFL